MARTSARLQDKRKANADTSYPQETGLDAELLSRKGVKSNSVPLPDEDAGELEMEDNDESGTARRNRIQKKGKDSSKPEKKTRKVRGILGFLQNLVIGLPLDVIFEIFVYLGPLDIIRLSRTSRQLRDVLTSRSAEYVWRNCRRNVEDVPPLPPDLNEIQFAVLLFDTHCQVCGYHPCENVIYDCRIRCCKKCTSRVLINWHKISNKYPGGWGVISSTEFLDPIPVYVEKSKGDRLNARYYLESAFAKRWEEVHKLGALNSQGRTVASKQKKVAWLASAKEERKTHLEHVKLCEIWQEHQRLKRLEELAELRRQRKEDIEHRLTASGWGPEIKRLNERSDPSFGKHKLVDQAVKLTDRSWTKIAPKLISEIMESERFDRLREERVVTLKARHLFLKGLYEKFILDQGLLHAGYPPFPDILESNLFYSVLWDTPFHRDLTADDIEASFDLLLEYVNRWKGGKSRELLELVQESVPEATIDSLDVASTVFVCMHCLGCLWYPQVLNHFCLNWPLERSFFRRGPDPDFDPGLQLFLGNPWSTSALGFSESSSRMMNAILQACDLPATSTVKDLDRLDPILECSECNNLERGRFFARWRRLLYHHCVRPGYLTEHCLFSVPDPTVQQDVLDVEKPLRIFQSVWADGDYFFCSLCTTEDHKDSFGTTDGSMFRAIMMPWLLLKRHLQDEHGVPSANIASEHWFWAPDTPLFAKTPLATRLKQDNT